MLRKYNSEKEIFALLRSFETATISREEWKHAEHLVVALCYLESHDLETATAKMRSGILHLLEKGYGLDLTKEMPYHETITVFWMRTAYAFSLMHKELNFVEKANRLCELFDKDYPLKFYSRELLFSDRARAEYVGPDLSVYPGAQLDPACEMLAQRQFAYAFPHDPIYPDPGSVIDQADEFYHA